MSKLSCKLFGVPKIEKDGQNVFLPYAKVNALLYYLFVNKVVSRDEISGLLWPDENEENAKKNLRNAVYQAKKALAEDVIISPKKSILMLNEELDIEIDVDRFLRDPQENMSLYDGDFLQGFFLKDADTYEYWVTKMRNYYKDKFSSECYLKIESDIQAQRYDQVEDRIRQLMELDEYDERNYRLLMRFYQDTGRNGKVIEVYYELSKLLRQELGIAPDEQTKEIYQHSLEQIHIQETSSASRDDSFFFGRVQEIASLEKALNDFKNHKGACRSQLIVGEPGSGKSTVLRRLLQGASGDFYVLEISGLQMEQDLPLRAWRAPAREIYRLIRQDGLIAPGLWRDLMSAVFPDFQESLPSPSFVCSAQSSPPISFPAVVHIMAEAITTLAARRPVLLAIDDIQWLDGDSLRLLTSVLLESDPAQVMLVATRSRERSQALESAISSLQQKGRLSILPLERFTIEACHHFIQEALPGEELRGDTLERIYNETEGNPFFLNEYIAMRRAGQDFSSASPAMTEHLKARFAYLSPEALNLAVAVSFFYGAVPLFVLQQVMNRSEREILGPLELLKDRDILAEESSEQGPAVSFTHPKLQEYLYKLQPESRRTFLHQEIGLFLEGQLNSGRRDSKLYPQLIYHFSASGNLLKALRYRIDSLNYHLTFSHAIFPILSNTEIDPESTLYISRDKIDALFQNLESDLQHVQHSVPRSQELELLELKFFYMRGRYLILEGQYETGVNDINYAIEKSKQLGSSAYTLECYKQLLFYYIQIDAPREMAEYIELALNLAVRNNDHKEIGVMLRLKGLYYMLTGSYDQAERMLTGSIDTLSVTEELAKRYAINIAAAYNYIGEIRQAREDYSGALTLFRKAVSLCPKGALSGLSVFYINIGKTCYFLSDFAGAREYFEKAYSLYGQFDSFWKRPILDSYTALTLVEEGDFQQALTYLNNARTHMERMKNPSDLGTVYFVEALIRHKAEGNPDLDSVFRPQLSDSAEHYYSLALKHLNRHLDVYETNRLHQIFDTDDD